MNGLAHCCGTFTRCQGEHLQAVLEGTMGA